MYSPHSPALSYGGDHNHHYHTTSHLNAGFHLSSNSSPSNYSTSARSNSYNNQQLHTNVLVAAAAAAANPMNGAGGASQITGASIQCLRFKYFATFFVCTTCLALLAASLATHKWLISKPVRVLRLNNGQVTNFTALMLTATLDDDGDNQRVLSSNKRVSSSQKLQTSESTSQLSLPGQQQQQQQQQQQSQSQSQQSNSKFQGEIYFGLFNGVKVLNYGFGERVSQLSVIQAYYATQLPTTVHELINFKFWLTTLTGVVMAIVFALIGSIFAIINFVMTPRATLMGPVGLVIWNAAACFACLIAMFAWLVEYFLRLKANVLTPEEVINGWTSENRSQFGYSYYFVVLAFCLHLVNIFIVSIVQADTWTSGQSLAGKLSSSAARRQNRASACEGVIMLY